MPNKALINEIIRNLRKVEKVDTIENVGFNMVHYACEDTEDYKEQHCGTTACIAGWAVFLRDPKKFRQCVANASEGEIHDIAANLLRLNAAEADDLFIPEGPCLTDVTPEQAIVTLKKLRDTGKVDWSHTPREEGWG